MKHDTLFLGRIPTFVFVLICIGASIFGAAALFIIGAFVVAVVEALIGTGPQSIYQLPTLIFMAAGFILPVVLLVRRRKRHRRPPRILPDFQVNSDQAESAQKPEQWTEGKSQSDFMLRKQRASEPSVEKIWYYADGSTRRGPISASEIERLVAWKEIDKDVQVWRKGMKDWAPIHETELVNKIGDVSPPLPSHAVNNIVVWLLAFSPLVFAAIDQTMRQRQALQMLGGDVSSLTSLLSGNLAGVPWFLPALSYFVFCVIDINLIISRRIQSVVFGRLGTSFYTDLPLCAGQQSEAAAILRFRLYCLSAARRLSLA